MTEDLPDYTETLNDLMAKQAGTWTDQDIEVIAASFRTLRERWNAEQAIGSRKLVKSTSIQTGRTQPVKMAIKNLKI